MSTNRSFEALPASSDLPAVILSGIVPVCSAYTKLIDHIRAGTCRPQTSAASLFASGYIALLRVRRILLARHPELPTADRICNELQKTVFRAYWLFFHISILFGYGVSYPHEATPGQPGISPVHVRYANDHGRIEDGTEEAGRDRKKGEAA